MGSRGRKPKVDMACPSNSPAMLRAPSDLSPAEADVFSTVVADCEPGHFIRSDLPLLVSYARAIVQERGASEMLRVQGAVVGTQVSPWVGVLRGASADIQKLSMRLRVSPQARRQRAKTLPPGHAQESYYDKMRREAAYADDRKR
jgi:phage terminase small subunit